MMSAEFADLPIEVALHIFSYFSTHVVRCILPLVCRSWSNLSKNQILWRNLIVDADGKDGHCLAAWPAPLAFIMATPQVRNLRFGFTCANDNVIEVLKMVNKNKIKMRKLEFLRPLQLVHIPLLIPSIVELAVDQLPITEDFSEFRRFSDLRTLDVYDIEASTLELLLPHVPQLMELKISGRIGGKLEKTVIAFMSNLKDLTLPLEEVDPSTLAELAKFPRLRSFSAVDTMPTLEKLLKLVELPLLHLGLAEPFSSPVLSSTALVKFFSSRDFLNLSKLRLLNSRLNDAGAFLLRLSCPRLWFLEVEKLQSCNDKDALTEFGLLHLLHLPLLRNLDIRVAVGRDWVYHRHRWRPHYCDAVVSCPVGLDELLNDWEDHDPIVVALTPVGKIFKIA